MSPRTGETLPTIEPIVPVLGSPPLTNPAWLYSPNKMDSAVCSARMVGNSYSGGSDGTCYTDSGIWLSGVRG
jgi:hypothetical protein